MRHRANKGYKKREETRVAKLPNEELLGETLRCHMLSDSADRHDEITSQVLTKELLLRLADWRTEKPNRAASIWFADFTCLICHRGSYQGYAEDGLHTTPCTNCGHVMPNQLREDVIRLIIDIRNKAINLDRESCVNLTCAFCSVLYPPIFIVHDELWQTTFPEDGIACLECFEKRLGRELALADLKPSIPINGWWYRRLG